MKNKYYPLRSSMDEMSAKNDNEIDLEKGPLPEYNSEDGSTLPPYSDLNNPKQMGQNITKLFNWNKSTTPPDYDENRLHITDEGNNPPNTHRENHSSGTADNSSPFLIKLLISFTPIVLLNAPAVCYLKYKDAFFKNYGAAEWTLFGFWCLVCTLALIFLTYFYETWTKAVKVTVIFLAQCVKVTVIFLAKCVKVTVIFLAKCVKVTAISLAKCIKVTAIFLAQCVKVTAVGLYNSREKWVVIIWLLWVVICYTLFLRSKFGNLNLNKALICSTCSISAALLLFLLYVRLPFWTLKHMFSGLFQVLGVQSCVVIVTKGLTYLFDKHIDATGYEIEASSLFVIGNFLFFYEMECPGALKRMPKFIRNGIASFLEGIGNIGNAIGRIGNAIGRIGNAFRGANDNNDIPLGEMEVESEV
uniref:Meiotic driver wtf36 n=2 Tax=Schizosaccharomyces pombe TaxID=4896 RepID=WTF36_SCHPM|nr:RecName: Full=Meiotic driver wtf36 [Schizosaccharomyces pombe]QBL54290.1 Wtf36 [Schizosaccharomyces pombe]